MILKKPVIGAHGATDWSVWYSRDDELGGGIGGKETPHRGETVRRGGGELEKGEVWR